MTGPAEYSPAEKPPLATGNMSTQGTTTTVAINKPKLDYTDKKVLCSVMCKCQALPGIGAAGRSLRQECVSARLKNLDEVLRHQSEYKAEFTYDMTKRPPEPFLDKAVRTKSRSLWPGWTQTLWPKDPDRPVPYKAGAGYTRRPDVVIVKDGTKPPTQDNIKQVVELKFRGDSYRPQQREDYIVIAGDETKMVSLNLEDCDCNQPELDATEVPVEHLGTAAAVLGIIYTVVTKRPPPSGVPAN